MRRVIVFPFVAVVLWGQTPERVLQSMKGTPVPEPAALGTYVTNRAAAIALGKALYWDMQVASDGVVACATCHFHAGADLRLRNQMHPGSDDAFSASRTGTALGPNATVKAGDFPFHVLSDPLDRNSTVVYQTNDVMGSQGVEPRTFTSATAGAVADACTAATGVARVTPRHTPTVINAAFHHRAFSDGRAGNSWSVTVYRGSPLAAGAVTLENAALAAQAVVPPVSAVEMACQGRTWPDIGRRLWTARALRRQAVSADDSVLGAYAATGMKGLRVTYQELVKQAFAANLWNAAGSVTLNGRTFSQAEANFIFFFGISVQLYEMTLVSDDAPLDRYFANYPSTAVANATALSAQEIAGMNVFTGKGRCASCHSGPQLTNAGTPAFLAAASNALVESMTQGDGRAGSYDFGFYNIGVRPTAEDQGVGPFALARARVTDGSRITVDGAFKAPSLRNVALTGPYFHTGGVATLEDVVEFYNRGGNRRGTVLVDDTGFGANPSNLGPDVRSLGLAPFETDALVAFLRTALTDERVRFERAPFDHPELGIAHGNGAGGREFLLLPAVGRNGANAPTQEFSEVLANGGPALPPVPAGWPNSAPAIALGASNTSVAVGARVTLTATVSDNDGDVARVEFWQGTTKIGEDATAPYTFTWTAASPGAFSFTARAVDAANLIGVSAAVTLAVTGAPATNGLMGEYYDGISFGALRFARTDATVNFGFGSAGPGQDVNARAFSVRWRGFVESPVTGTVVFCSTADSGMRIRLAGTLVADNYWNGAGTTTTCGNLAMTLAQRVAVEIDYYNDNGAGVAQLRWWYAGGVYEVVPARYLTAAPAPAAGTGLTATYFDGIAFATAKLTRVDRVVDFNWGTSGPGGGVNTARYSVRWTGQVESPFTGAVTFCGTSDDGFRVSVNGALVVNSFYDHQTLTACGVVSLEKGKRYPVTAEYYNNAGPVALVRLEWWYPGGVRQVVPTAALFEK